MKDKDQPPIEIKAHKWMWMCSIGILIMAVMYIGFRTYSIISTSKLVYYENRDVSIVKGTNGKFSYLYKSFNAKNYPHTFFEKRTDYDAYDDSANAERPFMVRRFRWAKFPSIHRYIYLNHSSLNHCTRFYFYCYQKGKSNYLYGISADTPPSKTYFILDVLSDTIGLSTACCLFAIWLLQWLGKRIRNIDLGENLPNQYLIIIFLMLVVAVIL